MRRLDYNNNTLKHDKTIIIIISLYSKAETVKRRSVLKIIIKLFSINTHALSTTQQPTTTQSSTCSTHQHQHQHPTNTQHPPNRSLTHQQPTNHLIHKPQSPHNRTIPTLHNLISHFTIALCPAASASMPLAHQSLTNACSQALDHQHQQQPQGFRHTPST